jgi:predicted acyltransferase
MTSSRLASVDAYRGLVMLLLLAEVLRLCSVSKALPDSATWAFLCHHQSHAQWAGCHLHDLIQPGFTFLVGVSLALSLAARRNRGDPFRRMATHAIVRSIVLVVLGIALISIDTRRVLLKFEDTLSQIGLGYPLVFLVAFKPRRLRWVVVALILAGYWLLFALYPVSPNGFDSLRAGVTSEWAANNALAGWEAHWQRNENFASWFDDWFLRLLPVYSPYANGLTTLNFIPTIATMILGLQAGEVLNGGQEQGAKLRWLVIAGIAGLVSGGMLDWTGVCPMVKSLWTPSWVLFSGGWCFITLAMFYYLVDMRGMRSFAFPLIVIGMNSIFAYVMSHMYPTLAFGALRRVFGPGVFNALGAAYEPVLYGLAVLACYWLVLYALYKLGWFLRI